MASTFVTAHKGVCIYRIADGFVWEEPNYGAESDDAFASVEAAKADIDCFFSDEPSLVLVDGELVHSVELL